MRKALITSIAGAALAFGCLLWTPAQGDSAAYGADDAAAGAKAKKKAKGKKGGDAVFGKLDTNNDGKLSKEEFSKFGKGKAKGLDKVFSKLDANSDGGIDKDEFKKAGDRRKKKKGADA